MIEYLTFSKITVFKFNPFVSDIFGIGGFGNSYSVAGKSITVLKSSEMLCINDSDPLILFTIRNIPKMAIIIPEIT
jgi:hypothetical protein